MSDSSRPTPDQLAEKVREGFTSVVTAPDGELCVDTGNSYDASLALSELVARLAASEAAREQAEQERDEARGDRIDEWADLKACEADRDRLAAALRLIATGTVPTTYGGGSHAMRALAREALNPGDVAQAPQEQPK